MTAQLAFFDAQSALPPGFRYAPDLISPDEEAELVARLREPPVEGARVPRSGASRSEWEHSIPPVESLRYSVTFRNLREGGTPPRHR
jgi:hypothetical protein